MAKSITLMQTGQRGSSENMAKLRRRIQYVISSEHAISEPLTAYGSLWPANRKILCDWLAKSSLTALITFKRKACKNESNVCRFLSQVRRVHFTQILKPTFQEFCGKFAVKLCKVRWSGDYLSPSDRPSVHCSQLFNDSGS
ncbi:hypothetical protein T4B_8864 [Trichinella pseudospiralis]|uniref:Uncharacterized protein n=1 Tax=Trichinella pseudospiralis TaxID=6337 RepID=A0A0V1J9D0_TRIPS|nr:hypothetical protein T4B_8864 [Trichinella pseudospiralis]